jgi:hypothetical protein
MKNLTLADYADYFFGSAGRGIVIGFPVWHWLFGLS